MRRSAAPTAPVANDPSATSAAISLMHNAAFLQRWCGRRTEGEPMTRREFITLVGSCGGRMAARGATVLFCCQALAR
jgi:hypothetical protein